MQARNAHFNLNRLGVIVQEYADNFYGTDYLTDPSQTLEHAPGLQSDRLFANWYLDSPRVLALARGDTNRDAVKPVDAVPIPSDWSSLVKTDVIQARREQERVRRTFKEAFADGLVCAGFERGDRNSQYLLFERAQIT
jgi:predicted GNAT superfamily acetyltransferase